MMFLKRFGNLIRGVLAQWLGRREHRNPGAVYEAAIEQRTQQYVQLREAAAGVLYMRGKLAKEVEMKTADLTRLRAHLDLALDRGDDEAALALIHSRDEVVAELERLNEDLNELTREADAAKANLLSFRAEITRLREEKARMLARLSNAKARLRLQETLSGLSPEADLQALDAVRDHINRLVAEVQVSRASSDQDLEARLAGIREAEAKASARAQLDELKKARGRALMPAVATAAAAS
jgi:phage shock protein A